jgi:hypothetical protein
MEQLILGYIVVRIVEYLIKRIFYFFVNAEKEI